MAKPTSMFWPRTVLRFLLQWGWPGHTCSWSAPGWALRPCGRRSRPSLTCLSAVGCPAELGQAAPAAATLQRRANISSKHDLSAKHWNRVKLSIYNFLPSLPPCAWPLACVSAGGGRKSTPSVNPLASPGPAPGQPQLLSGCMIKERDNIFRQEHSIPAQSHHYANLVIRSLKAWNHRISLFH